MSAISRYAPVFLASWPSLVISSYQSCPYELGQLSLVEVNIEWLRLECRREILNRCSESVELIFTNIPIVSGRLSTLKPQSLKPETLKP